MPLLGPNMVVRSYFTEVVGGHNLTALDEYVSRDFVGHAAGGDFTRADLRRALKRDQEQRPNAELILIELYSAGTRVITRWRSRWRHERPLFGETPTGAWLELNGITIDGVEDSKITERWESKDLWQVIQQLGGIPTFPDPTPPGA